MKISDKKGLSGFSLIEVALMLIVIGGVVVLGLSNFATKKRISHDKQVLEDLKEIRAAIQSYSKNKGHLPCPAPIGVPEESAEYAVEYRDDNGWCNVSDGNKMKFTITRYVENGPTFNELYFTDEWGHSGPDYAAPWQYPDAYYDRNSDQNSNQAKLRPVQYVKGEIPCKDLGLSPDCGLSPEGYRYAYVVVPSRANPRSCSFYMVKNQYTVHRDANIYNGIMNQPYDDTKLFSRPQARNETFRQTFLDTKVVATVSALPASSYGGDVYRVSANNKYYRWNSTLNQWLEDATERSDGWTADGHYISDIGVFKEGAGENQWNNRHIYDKHFAVIYHGADGVGAYDRSGGNIILPTVNEGDKVIGHKYARFNYGGVDDHDEFTNDGGNSSSTWQRGLYVGESNTRADIPTMAGQAMYFSPINGPVPEMDMDDILLFGMSKESNGNCMHCQFAYPVGRESEAPDKILRYEDYHPWSSLFKTYEQVVLNECGVNGQIPKARASENASFCASFPMWCE